MQISEIQAAGADELAPFLPAALQRMGQLGREGAIALARLVEGDDADLDEAGEWITDIIDGGLRD